jgi:hypothetical protein
LPQQKIGWKEGEGLGRNKQGNVDIIHTVEKYDRGGLGFADKESSG